MAIMQQEDIADMIQKDCHQQTDGYNCGIFALAFLKALLKGEDVPKSVDPDVERRFFTGQFTGKAKATQRPLLGFEPASHAASLNAEYHHSELLINCKSVKGSLSRITSEISTQKTALQADQATIVSKKATVAKKEEMIKKLQSEVEAERDEIEELEKDVSKRG
jgi:hypothetical protein